MGPVDSLKVAFSALAAHKLRSFLTVLGIVIGVAAVISLMSIGTGAQKVITSQIEALGSNLLIIYPAPPEQQGVRGAIGGSYTLTEEDAEAIARSVSLVTAVAPQASTFAQVIAGRENINTRILGVTPEYLEVRNYSLAAGQFITQQHLQSRARAAVLGAQVAEELFGDASLAVGRRIRIGRFPVKVIGVLEPKGGLGSLADDVVMIPLTSLQRALARRFGPRGEKAVQLINVQVVSRDMMGQAKEEIAELLRMRHRVPEGEEDFIIISQEEMLRTVTQVTGILTLFLGSIAGISLLVGGIGVMNIMLVSVTERVREIGIRMAVGARRRDILAQFLIESTTLSLGGGVIGILLGLGGSRLIPMLAEGKLSTMVSPGIILLAFSVAAAVGIFFGIYPAYRASRLNPAEALRYE